MLRLICFLCLFIQVIVSIDEHQKLPITFNDDIEDTDFWAIKINNSSSPHRIADQHGHFFVGQVGQLSDYYLILKKQDTIHGVTHPHLHENENILWSERQVSRKRSKRAITDPLYANQWHLHGSSTNVRADKVWDELGITGKGVVIAVVDDGLEYTHPDLAANYDSVGSYDINYNDPNPFPDSPNDDHGTSAAGVAGARDNNVCGVGVAYRASLASIRLISKGTTDSQEAAGIAYAYNHNQIYSNSWGPIDDGRRKEGPGTLAALTFQQAVSQGRQGKGSVFIWAAGNGKRNGDNCNYDGWANSRYTISIGAVDSNGYSSWYSENCAMLLGVAPSSGSTLGITTTDLKGARGGSGGDCTSSFGGTSAAAPLVAGLTALVLEANPNLTWRDVQGVLIAGTVKNDPSDTDWVLNGAGLWVNHKYGFGLIDAYNSVKAAQEWQNLSPLVSSSVSKVDTTVLTEGQVIDVVVPFTLAFTVEHVELLFLATHPRRGDLRIELISPAGTKSVLAEYHHDTNPDYNWTFGTIRHWGETSVGQWIVRVKDESAGFQGQMQKVQLTIYGH